MTIKLAIGSSIFKIRSLSTFDSCFSAPMLLLSASPEFSETTFVIVFVSSIFVSSSSISVSSSSIVIYFVFFVEFVVGEGAVVVMTFLKVNGVKL